MSSNQQSSPAPTHSKAQNSNTPFKTIFFKLKNLSLFRKITSKMNGFTSFVFTIVLIGLIGEGFCHSLRVRREGDEDVIEQIKQHLTRLRHAESRLKKFTDEIETGLETGMVKTALAETEDKTEKGQVDFFKLVKAFKEHTPNSFEDLIKRVADDTHILMDQLYGRLDDLGVIVEGAKHDEADTSAEEHHSKAA